MKFSYSIQGIQCRSCIEKITTLLQSELSATAIKITEHNKKLEFDAADKVEITRLNQILHKIGNYTVSVPSLALDDPDKNPAPSYRPIYLIFSYLILANALIGLKLPNIELLMANFMASFFLVFSFFKMLDLKGFAAGYASYDLIAKKFYHYGYLYPFLELGFGCGYLIAPLNLYLNISVFSLMLISALGVIKAKLSRQNFYCACVGTFLRVPLGSIAILEDGLMTIMACGMLIHLLY